MLAGFMLHIYTVGENYVTSTCNVMILLLCHSLARSVLHAAIALVVLIVLAIRRFPCRRLCED